MQLALNHAQRVTTGPCWTMLILVWKARSCISLHLGYELLQTCLLVGYLGFASDLGVSQGYEIVLAAVVGVNVLGTDQILRELDVSDMQAPSRPPGLGPARSSESV